MGRLRLPVFPVVAGLLFSSAAVEARELSFEERVRAQEAIERVYYSYQTGASRPFEEAVPREALERKVRTYLKQTIALESFWKTSVTSDMLRRELERMTTKTQMPGRLRQLFAALGDDPLLVHECLARPVLVDRLARNFFDNDSVINSEARRRGEELHEDLANGRLDPRADEPGRTVTEIIRIQPGGRGGLDAGTEAVSSEKQNRSRLELPPDQFNRYLAGLPARGGDIGPLTEERQVFSMRTVLEREEGHVRVVTFVVRKLEWDEWWRSVEGRLDEQAVHAARAPEGLLPTPLQERAEVSPSSSCLDDEFWDDGSLDDLPDPRDSHTAVWTGSHMIVWGGGSYLNTGGRYDPVTDTWTPTSTTNAPSPRSLHSAVWAGSFVVVWGGVGASNFNTGALYDAAADTWIPTSTKMAASPRHFHSAVWMGSQMVVWGGFGGSYLNTGGRYAFAPSLDHDGDGFSKCQGDCNESNPAIHPGATEVCNGVDDNCDGSVDGFATSCGVGQCASTGSCTDRVDSCVPGSPSPEVCDGIDNNCDGVVDNAPVPAGSPSVVMVQFGRTNVLGWDSLPDATGYDVVQSDLRALLSNGGVFTPAIQGCLANDLGESALVLSGSPAGGTGFFYLVRGVNCSGPGTYDEAGREVGSRDTEIDAAPLSCL